MTNEDFDEVYYPKYNSVIRAIARKLANTNDALTDDLYQEGLMALWLCNPQGAQRNQDAYIRQAVKFRMIDFLRREKLADKESLDLQLEHGRQVVRGDDGALSLVRDKRSSRARDAALGNRAESFEDDEYEEMP